VFNVVQELLNGTRDGVYVVVNDTRTNYPSSNNGHYILNGLDFNTWLSTYVGSQSSPLTIDRKNAITSNAPGTCASEAWYYASTESAVKALWNADCTGGIGITQTSVSVPSGVFFQVIEV